MDAIDLQNRAALRQPRSEGPGGILDLIKRRYGAWWLEKATEYELRALSCRLRLGEARSDLALAEQEARRKGTIAQRSRVEEESELNLRVLLRDLAPYPKHQ